jgi:hypothetical protein
VPSCELSPFTVLLVVMEKSLAISSGTRRVVFGLRQTPKAPSSAKRSGVRLGGGDRLFTS